MSEASTVTTATPEVIMEENLTSRTVAMEQRRRTREAPSPWEVESWPS